MLTCFERLQEIAKDNYTDAELRQILKDAENNLSESAADIQKAINTTTDGLNDSIKLDELKLNLEELNVARSANLFEPFSKLKRDPLKRFGEALTLGTRVGVKGVKARELSINLLTKRMEGRTLFANTIDSVNNGMPILKSSQYEESILKAINGKETNNKITNELGKKISDLREVGLKEMEKHGIFIKKLENRGIYQTHNSEALLQIGDTLAERTKIRLSNLTETNKAELFKDISFGRWQKKMIPLLNLERTFGEITAQSESKVSKIMRSIYDTITSDATSLGKASIQSQADSSRFFHFKDEISQLNYNRIYGRGTLFDALTQEFDSTWNKIGTLEIAGNTPLNYISKTIKVAAKQLPVKLSQKLLDSKIDEAQYAMQQTLGVSSTVQGMSGKLVKAIKLALFAKIVPTITPLVVVADLAPSISTMAQLGGKGLFRSSLKIFGIAKNILTKEDELNKFVQAMGFRRDIQLGSVEKWSGLATANIRNRLISFMMKLSPHEFMNYVEGLSTAHELTLMLGQNSKLAFDKLPPKLSKTLDLYGIDGDRWNLMRKGITEIGGYTHLTTDAMRNIDKDSIKTFIKKKFNLQKVSDARVEQEREQNQQLFTQMVTDKMATASNLVDSRQRSFWNLNFNLKTRKGRLFNNLFSIVGSLRYYETSIVHRTLAPLIYGESGESVMGALLSGKFDKIGLARWGALSFSLSTIAFTLQSLMRGEDPNEKEVLTRSMLAPLGAIGQGLEVGKGFGHEAWRTVAGPGPSMLFDSIDDLAGVIRDDHPARNATNFVTTAIPGFNNNLSKHAIRHMMNDQFGNMYRG